MLTRYFATESESTHKSYLDWFHYYREFFKFNKIENVYKILTSQKIIIIF
jgi:hypothetical protein